MSPGYSDYGSPGFSDSRGLILLLLATAFLLPRVWSRYYPAPRLSVGGRNLSLASVTPRDRAILPLLRFGRIDINHAGYHTLTRVPGIGPARARAIIKLRKKTGRFSALNDLVAIRGIGSRTVGDLAVFLTIAGP